MAQYKFTDKTGVQQGTFYYYVQRTDKVEEFNIIMCFADGSYKIESLQQGAWSYHILSKNAKVFTTRKEAEQYADKLKADKKKEADKKDEQQKKHDEMVDAYFKKQGNLKADDFVRMIKRYFSTQQQYTYIARKLRPEPEPFEYYYRAFVMLRNGYVDYKCGENTTGRCYFKNVDYAEVEKTYQQDKYGNDEYRVTLYKNNNKIFSTTCRDLVVPLRMIFTNYAYDGDVYSSGWKNNADSMNTIAD